VLSFRRLRCLPRAIGLAVAGLASVAALSGPARAADPVSATAKVVSAHGEISEVAVEVAIKDGWHVNSDRPSLEFLIPTGVEFDLPEGVSVETVTYPDPVIRQLKFGGDKQLSLFEGEFAIRVRLSGTEATAGGELAVKLRYQACNDTVCLRPTTVTLPVDSRASSSSEDAQPSGFRQTGSAVEKKEGGNALAWVEFTSEAYIQALREDAPFVMGFSAEWCLPCKEMYERTYTDRRVIEAAEGVRLFEVDSTEKTEYISRVMESFDVKGLPTTLFFDSGGRELSRRGGYIPAPEFARLLSEVKKASKPEPAASPSAI
jgi:thiol:disulfide interchange protein